MTPNPLGLPPFTLKERVYWMCKNRIREGVVIATFEVDSLTKKYLVRHSTGNYWMLDYMLYHSAKELFDDLQSCIVK